MNLAMLAITAVGFTAHHGAALKGDVQFDGMYVEGCSCSAPCPCEITGLSMGCQGVGGFSIGHGSFEGADVSGVKFAYATTPGDWVICYVDASTEAKRSAGAALAKAAFGAWGKMGDVKTAPIELNGSGGKYTLTVDDGKIMSLTTEPFFGLDKTKPITYSNINSVVHPQVMQAKTLVCTFHDGDKKFEIKGSNAYYNPAMKVHGVLGGGA